MKSSEKRDKRVLQTLRILISGIFFHQLSSSSELSQKREENAFINYL